ncbi:asparagine synthase (glutamine-hydrolyzing) (plasmid) [Pseudohalocynthiibacter aestuariivivens]|uniref:asparagine synthase (glutamine-hydrolyzing) n=1 Tax=Roseovarius pelagicus TaxID=2980108 RepID=A0ABY6D5J2_9RHOB|nr:MULTISPECIES: asparagine synthase (glutamine-hydrolyzing) [Rhodobacterales]QIE47917.1 asparagine synthase (glutamine-hydrolyzing) [Pseudohalocynthiibacter aestuariivivens]UXX81411.1 asparagine synthase (glutamine-hydrolyzing) [Roseovarius pelagicus]
MCGIFGSFSFQRTPLADDIIAAMSHSIVHRGPDAQGYFSDDLAVVGNRRLSILDLSEASDQPLYSEDGQVVVVQNGEIFNFIELRAELQALGAVFNSTGDTEVLLHAYLHWGPDFVTRLNGMFAIAVYDIGQRTLLIYRDRLGVKPLYIAGTPEDGWLWFGSEIKAILANGQSYKTDMTAIAQYLALNYIPQPSTVFEGIRHLPPGHMARISCADGIEISRYWDLLDVVPEPEMTEAEGKAGLLSLLDDATRIRMRADAPFGAFLSGGLDSSSVVGFMSLYQTEPVHTFSIGFDDPRFDETSYAKMAARRFGTQHEMHVMDHDTTAFWPRFIWHCDQPHGDVSFIPTDQVAGLAARDVKMVLTGDGGDELFAGYEKYLALFPDGKTDHLQPGWEDAFVRTSGLLQNDEPDRLLTGDLHAAFHDTNPYQALSDEIRRAPHQDPINRVLFAETNTLLPGNNLVKPDRMAMANSLEVRSPFLDYRMAEFAFRMPGHLKLSDGQTKWIYKKAVEPLLGAALTWRKKQMFTVPVGEWFRQALAGYCRDVLLDGRLEGRKIVNTAMVEQMISDHIAGTANYTRQLRALISLEIWFRLFVDNDDAWIAKTAA